MPDKFLDAADISLADAELLAIDKICDRFEADWKSGKQPKVEDFLGNVVEPTRSVLRRELASIDAVYRRTKSPLSIEAFIERLTASGLMEAREVESFLDQLPAEQRPKTGEQLAKDLFRSGKLTKFQVQAVYQGKTRGLVVGNYVILEQIGKGGMGTVYKARHRRMDRVVALKVLPHRATKSKDMVKRFHREVKAAARLSHPHIVSAYDADEAKGVEFFVMEYVEGQDLASLLKEKTQLPVPLTLDLILQAARGLEYAHRRGVIHRDIKPGNLMVSRDGMVKILDMGLARLDREMNEAQAASELGLTQIGQVMGTLDYMSPEQGLDTKTADARSDVYSLGCSLFTLLCGRPVYKADTLAAIILAHREGAIPSIRELRPDVPRALDNFFARMIAKQPEDRPQSMTEVVEELQRLQQTLAQENVEAGQALATAKTFYEEAFAETTPQAPKTPLWFDGILTGESVHLVHRGTAPSQAWGDRLAPLWQRVRERPRLWVGVAVGFLCLLVAFGVVIKLRTKYGTLVVTVNQPDAEIGVDDGKVTITSPGDQQPVQVQVAEGKHMLRVTKNGFETYTEEFSIRKDGEETVRVALVRKGRGSDAAFGKTALKPAAKPALSAAPASPKPFAAIPAPVAAATSDPQRRAAEAVLRLGGTVHVQKASGRVAATALKDLPAEPFALFGVTLGRADVHDADLMDLTGVYYLADLCLIGTSITDAGLKTLGGVDTPQINLCDTAIGDNAVKWLSGRQDLLTLHLGTGGGASPLRITDAACTHLKQLPRLRFLNLCGSEMGDPGLAELAGLRSLRHLDVGVHWTAEGLALLCVLPNLQQLGFGATSLGDDVIDILSRFPQLRLVHLLYTDCPEPLALRLQEALPNASILHPAVAASEPERKSLRWLLDNKAVVWGAGGTGDGTFQDVPNGAFAVRAVAVAGSEPASGAVNLRGLRSIEDLTWPLLKMADVEAEHLTTLTTLTSVNLSGSDLSDAGIERLANLKQLEQLDFSSCQKITNRGLEHLTTLEHLFLLGIAITPISDEGLASVGRISGLQNLDLRSCTNLTSGGLNHLVRLPILRVLNLDSTPIDDGAVQHLKQMSCLRILWLNNTKLTASGIEELRGALPKCVIFWDGGAVIPGASPSGTGVPE